MPAIVGAGVQGEQHLRTFLLVRDIHEVRISSLIQEDAERLAAADPRARAVRSAEEAVRGADVVALATHAARPVVEPDWIAPGTHVSSVGYRPPEGELLLGRADGRRGNETTVCKARGHVAEDIAAAELVYAAARRDAAGVLVEL